MMWMAGAGAVVLITIILALAFRLSNRTKALGKALERIENLELGNDWLRAALGNQSSADASLDDLDGMHETEADRS